MRVTKSAFHFICDRLTHMIIFGGIYFLIECLWKGHLTDWRMFVLAAVIGVLIGSINEFFTYETDFILQCIVGTLIALICECVGGYQWNIVEGLAIWDYSSLPFSAVGGQINLFFAMAWMFLSGVCIILDDILVYYFHANEERPYYRIGKRYFKWDGKKIVSWT